MSDSVLPSTALARRTRYTAQRTCPTSSESGLNSTCSTVLICEHPQRAKAHLLTGRAGDDLQAVSPLHPTFRSVNTVPEANRTSACARLLSNASTLILHCTKPFHLSLLEQLREVRSIETPVIALCDPNSARGIAALTAGADFVYAPPVSVQTLQASRIAFARKQTGSSSNVITPARTRSTKEAPSPTPPVNVVTPVDSVGPIEVDAEEHTVTIRGEKEVLTGRAFELLRYLIQRHGECCSRADVMEDVWDLDFDPGTNIVDVQVYKLRKLLADHDLRGMIKTVRGTGYRLVWPLRSADVASD